MSYFEVVLAPELLVGLAEVRAALAGRVADLLHLVPADLAALLPRHDATTRPTLADVKRRRLRRCCRRRLAARVVVDVVDDDVRLRDAPPTLVHESTAGDVFSDDDMSCDDGRNVRRQVPDLLQVFRGQGHWLFILCRCR